MKIFIPLLFFLSAGLSSQAQKKMAIYGELLGNGFLFASINMEYNFNDTGYGYGIRVGFSVIDISTGDFTVPIMGHYIIGKKKHKLELGMGILYVKGSLSLTGDPISGSGFTSSIMYRFHADSGFMIKVGVAPFYSKSSIVPYPMPGLAVGKRF